LKIFQIGKRNRFQAIRRKNACQFKGGIDMVQDLPADARIIYDGNCWLIFYSPSEKSIFLDTSDYHPDPLQLTKENLLELIKVIDQINSTIKLK
jgi:hypothetical protein